MYNSLVLRIKCIFPFSFFLLNWCFVVADLQAKGEVSIGNFPITLHPPLPTVSIPTPQVRILYMLAR